MNYSMEIHWSNEDDAFVVTLAEFRMPDAWRDVCGSGEKWQEVWELLIETYRQEGRTLPEPLTLDRVG